jgi:hypothetical protein
MEVVLGRKTRTSVRGEGWDGVVPSCPHCGSRSLQVLSGSSTLELLSTPRLTLNALQIRLYSRDAELANKNVLHREILTSPIIVLSLVDNSLLVYTADNNLHHYLVVPTPDTIKTHFCGTINFNGIIASPGSVRTLSWMLPSAQKRMNLRGSSFLSFLTHLLELGDPVDDLAVATVLMMVGGKLVLLRPRKVRSSPEG